MNDERIPLQSRTRAAWPAALAFALLGLAALLRPDWLRAAWGALNTESIAGVVAHVRGFGLWAPAISLLLMLLQSVVAPLPGSIVAAMNGVVFGIWWGTLLSWTGGLLGATASFWLARLLGQSIVQRWFGSQRLQRVDAIGEGLGFWLILVARLTPLVSFDLISYVSGLSSIGYARFMLATAVGMLPGTFAWTALGHDLAMAQTTTWRLSLLGLFAVVAALAGHWWQRRAMRQTD
ncbi:MAG TPA: TVP38/TMEM64 family protein [Roseiflexaceae bacterium]|nr:TVP38/TMEM64 family protein [Roseiflexaceae bacterium]